MILYMSRDDIPDIENLSSEVIHYVVTKAEAASGRFVKLENYYRGEHGVKIAPDSVGVVANYAKYIVDTVLGYYLTEPVKYDPNDGYDIDAIMDAYTRQAISNVDFEIGRQMGTFGEALEVLYASSDEVPVPKSTVVKPYNGVLVCDDTVEHNKLFAMIWEKREDTHGGKFYAVTIYTDQTAKIYVSGDLKAETVSYRIKDENAHFFGEVPVIAYTNNADKQGDFEQVISLIDAYNALLSNRLTDKKKFVDALLVFFGMTLREGDEKNLAKEKFLDGAPLDARVEYIQKTFDESQVQVLADSIVREIHKQTMTVDMSDEKFSGNASGQALKLKLLTMNMLVKGKIRQVERGLVERWRMYNRWLETRGAMTAVDIAEVDINFTLSTPINEQEVVQTVTQLKGVVDDQTLLGQLWFIRDPAEALEAIQKQKQEDMERYQTSFGNIETEEDDQTARDDE